MSTITYVVVEWNENCQEWELDSNWPTNREAREHSAMLSKRKIIKSDGDSDHHLNKAVALVNLERLSKVRDREQHQFNTINGRLNRARKEFDVMESYIADLNSLIDNDAKLVDRTEPETDSVLDRTDFDAINLVRISHWAYETLLEDGKSQPVEYNSYLSHLRDDAGSLGIAQACVDMCKQITRSYDNISRLSQCFNSEWVAAWDIEILPVICDFMFADEQSWNIYLLANPYEFAVDVAAHLDSRFAKEIKECQRKTS